MSCIIKRILQFKSAVVFGKVELFDVLGNNVTDSCKYSWSSDGVCWTSWVNYNSYLSLAKNIESDFYLRILIYTSIGKVFINSMETTCYSTCLYNENPFIENLCTQSTFNPYAGLDCALDLQRQLADGIICMLGIPVYYFRVLPDKETADYTFKEYVMHNVESVKQIKLMIQDGTMPSSKPQFSDFDFDWETDWEVELGKTEFARAFGDTAFPKQRDFIYIPMMQRMWEVNSAYDEKMDGLLWRSTTWKLGLVKWNEKTNVEQGDFDEIIDNLIVNTYDNVFAELESNEESRKTATSQIERPLYTSNSLTNLFLQDSIRKQMTKNSISIKEKQYNQGSVVTAKNIYSFEQPDSLVNYQKGYCGEDGTFMFIFNNSVPEKFSFEIPYTIVSFGNICIKSDKKSMYFGSSKIDLPDDCNDFMIICRWSRKDFIQEIHAYPYKAPENIPVYRIRPDMYRFDFSNDIFSVSEYNNDYRSKAPKEISVTAYPFSITNIKLYNKYLSNEESIKESVKYTTKSEFCVVNDLARPLDTGAGYSPK